jgi:hypothetical protein
MKSQKKLELSQETLRNLTSQELSQAVGGFSGTCVRLTICCTNQAPCIRKGAE